MTRVVGIDPGTVSVDLCGLEDGEVAFATSFPTADLAADAGRLVDALTSSGPLDGAVAPSGYGLPLARLAELDEAALRLAFLSVPDGAEGIPRVARSVAALREVDVPVWILPGVVHLPTVPEHRKVNRIDMGTADKLCAAALAVAEQAGRRDVAASETDFLLLELGGAFTSVLSVQGGAVVDGVGGSSGPPGVRAPGCLDGEVAVVLGEVTKRHVFSGGAAAVAAGRRSEAPGAQNAGTADAPPGEDAEPDPAAWAGADGPAGVAWRHLMEGAEKACRSLQAVHPTPHEILLSGRHASTPAVVERLSDTLGSMAPVRRLEGLADGASTAAQGAALLADGLAGGRHLPLVETLHLRETTGTVFDHLYLDGVADGAARWLRPSG